MLRDFRLYNQYSKTMKFGIALITGLIIAQGSCGGAIIQNKYGNYGPVSSNKETVNDYQKQNTNTVDLGQKDQGDSSQYQNTQSHGSNIQPQPQPRSSDSSQ
jgi:hypothetical protein